MGASWVAFRPPRQAPTPPASPRLAVCSGLSLRNSFSLPLKRIYFRASAYTVRLRGTARLASSALDRGLGNSNNISQFYMLNHSAPLFHLKLYTSFYPLPLPPVRSTVGGCAERQRCAGGQFEASRFCLLLQGTKIESPKYVDNKNATGWFLGGVFKFSDFRRWQRSGLFSKAERI